MKELTLDEILIAIGGKLLKGPSGARTDRVVIDSREVKKGDTFFAIKGPNADGHNYINKAAEAGASIIVISDETKLNGLSLAHASVILVPNTVKALQDLGSYYLKSLPLKHKVAITGSVGKTTTRELTYAVLSRKYITSKNEKNYNSDTGLPLTIFNFRDDTEIAILEIGISSEGTLLDMANFVKPDMAIFTNIGLSHIEAFGDEGRHGILRAKLHTCDFFNEDSKMVVNGDCDMLSSSEVMEKYMPITVGKDPNSKYFVHDILDLGDKGILYRLRFEGKDYDVSLPIPGAHNAINATLALAMGKELGIELEDGILGLKEAELTGKRLNITEKNGFKVIDDTYNAAPDSMISAINTLMAIEGEGRKIAVLGDMYELGNQMIFGHEEVGRHAAKKGVKLLVGVGPNSTSIVDGWLKENPTSKLTLMSPLTYENDRGDKAIYYENLEALNLDIKDILRPGDVALFKASHGMHMDEAVKKVLE